MIKFSIDYKLEDSKSKGSGYMCAGLHNVLHCINTVNYGTDWRSGSTLVICMGCDKDLDLVAANEK